MNSFQIDRLELRISDDRDESIKAEGLLVETLLKETLVLRESDERLCEKVDGLCEKLETFEENGLDDSDDRSSVSSVHSVENEDLLNMLRKDVRENQRKSASNQIGLEITKAEMDEKLENLQDILLETTESFQDELLSPANIHVDKIS